VTDGLLDPFRHNSWATRRVIAYLRHLEPEQLDSSSPGTYGSILVTLQHTIGAEGRYRTRLAGAKPDWPRDPEETDDLDALSGMNDDVAAFWESLAAGGFDPERVIAWTSEGSGAHTEVRAGVLVAQVLNHGNEHRAQICTILGSLGLEVPEIDGWSYAIDTGRFTEDPVVHTIPQY
jgi:uncharacterized damage-inducible protein DinB